MKKAYFVKSAEDSLYVLLAFQSATLNPTHLDHFKQLRFESPLALEGSAGQQNIRRSIVCRLEPPLR